MRNQNIDLARQRRQERTALLAGVRNRADLIRLLEEPPSALHGCPVHLVLRACPGIGDIKVRQLLQWIWPLTTVGDLDPGDRMSLVARLRR